MAAPLMIESYEQYEYVIGKMAPQFDRILEQKGFVVLNWGEVGFVHFFSTTPLRSPAETRAHKIFTWDGDPASVDGWKSAGFQPVVLSATDVVPSLQTGMINTVAAAPLYAFTARYFQKANKMTDLPWGLLVGAMVVKKDTWEQVPADLRPKLLGIAGEYSKRVSQEVRRMNEDALTQMKKQGLEVVAPTDLAGWRKVADNANVIVRGKVVPAPVFDEVKRLAQEYRAGKR
jgi:TRAP-type C4-dicarboxylate transport system substrate-binding protein